jgi:transcriptional regulator with XRE-family HTH domain
MKQLAKTFNEKMAIYLREMRTDKNLSMRALAEMIGTPHSFVGKTETQGRRMDVGEFVVYCQAMQLDPTVVLKNIMKL